MKNIQGATKELLGILLTAYQKAMAEEKKCLTRLACPNTPSGRVSSYGYFAALNPAESQLWGATKPHQRDRKISQSQRALAGVGVQIL